MIVRPSVTIEDRDQELFLRDLESRGPGYVPGWNPAPQDPGYALQVITARYLQAIVNRLNQSPDKNKLAFLDLMGQRLSPARAARTPLVFQLSSDVNSALAPAGTAAAAPPPVGSNQQIVFQTESDIGIMAGKLVEVFSLWPGRDEYIDHSGDYLSGKELTLFDRAAFANTPHVLYLSHPVLLNLSGNVTLEVEFQLLHPATTSLQIVWEYWDGKVWRGFAAVNPDCETQKIDPLDATSGLTASGVVTLKADCATADKTSVNGINGFWIRGRLTQALPPDPAKPLPEVEAIRISSLVSEPLSASLKDTTPAATAGTLALTRMAPLEGFSLPETFAFTEFFFVSAPAMLRGTVVNEGGQPLGPGTGVVTDPNEPAFGSRPFDIDEDGQFRVLLESVGKSGELRFEVTISNVRAGVNVKLTSTSAVIQLTMKLSGLRLTKAFNDGTKLDTTKPCKPFGDQPQPGTVFYFNSKEIFAKPGANFRMYLPRTEAPSDKLKTTENGQNLKEMFDLEPRVVWEYWNGREWAELQNLSATTVKADFEVSEILDFRVPLDLVPVEVNQDVDLWMRARLLSGGYGFYQTLTFKTGVDASENKFTMVVPQPPVLSEVVLGYAWQFGPFHPEAVFTFNDFRYEDHTYEAVWPGSSFKPYQRLTDTTPTLFLGFDQKPPIASIGIFFDILEQAGGGAIDQFTWEFWDGYNWSHLSVIDETAHLTSPGILSFIAASDAESYPRFGRSLYWIRARLKEDGPPSPVIIRGGNEVSGIFPNAVWAVQQRAFTDVILGKATGQPSEIFQVNQTPVMTGETLEVLELSGARANVEWRLVALELFRGNNDEVRRLEAMLGKENLPGDPIAGDLRLRRDKQKRVTEVWVRWHPQTHLLFSKPNDRHYAFDRARGLIFFGDGINGRTLPIDSVVNLRSFTSGGGADGNVAARAISQLQGAVPGVAAVFNPRPAEGGADGETLEAFRRRAPASVRHRGRALTSGDYEAMVREASSAIAVVKAIANRNPAGRRLPGWLTIFIIPESKDPRPYPTRGLRDEIFGYLAARAPAGLASGGKLFVTGPVYVPVDVAATIVPDIASQAGLIETRARLALTAFLHPLHGGPSDDGWDFGRGVYLSDVASVLESVEGLKHAETIQLLINDEVCGDFAAVLPDQIVMAGSIRLKLKGAEG